MLMSLIIIGNILFGKLAQGGQVRIYIDNDDIAFVIESAELEVSEVNS